MSRLDGRVAIVTGGGSGIGRETAKRLAAEGATVVVNGRRTPPLEGVVAEITAAGGRASVRQADVASPSQARALGEWTLATHGRVDVLVNNAGFASRVRNVRWLPQEDWDAVLAVNLTGVYALTQSVLGDMIARGDGTIVTVSSVAALRSGLMSGPAYGAAKAGVLAFMRYLHHTFRQQGIRATTILPAEVDTPILARRPLPPDEAARATMMKPEDVAAAVLLCVTLPHRAVIEELVMSPTILRDQSRDLEMARRIGEPGWAPPAT
jgi:NAD(P)-dependent dehydrogenase (short-subunit alcohol dehydrogenase family)